MAFEMDFTQLKVFLGDTNNNKQFYDLAQSESLAICLLLSDTQKIIELASINASAISLLAELQPQLLLSKLKNVGDLLSLSKIANDAVFFMVFKDAARVISLFKNPIELVEFAICARTAYAVLLNNEFEKIKGLFKVSTVPEDLMQQCKNASPSMYKNFLTIIELVQLENKNHLNNPEIIEEHTHQKPPLDKIGLFKKQEVNTNPPAAVLNTSVPAASFKH